MSILEQAISREQNRSSTVVTWPMCNRSNLCYLIYCRLRRQQQQKWDDEQVYYGLVTDQS